MANSRRCVFLAHHHGSFSATTLLKQLHDLDVVVVTHSDSDHAAIGEVLGDARIRRLLLVGDPGQPTPYSSDHFRSFARAATLLASLTRLMPERITDEELGDFLEAIVRRIKNKEPAWSIRLRVCETVFWLTMHSIMHIVKSLVRMRKAG